MIPEPLDEFDVITSEVPMLSPLQAMFAWAEEKLLAERPGGFEVEDIGRLAYRVLPDGEKAQAFDELLYTYWEAFEANRAMQAYREQAGGEQR
ncbi:hypothetical protein [Streptomyces sp. NPDC003857]